MGVYQRDYEHVNYIEGGYCRSNSSKVSQANGAFLEVLRI